jgi:hypothetical protein
MAAIKFIATKCSPPLPLIEKVCFEVFALHHLALQNQQFVDYVKAYKPRSDSTLVLKSRALARRLEGWP